jgi:hypothetical protein
VSVSVQLEKHEVAGLERVAEGRASSIAEPVAGRLLALGLVQRMESHVGHAAMLQLTAAGLSLIRSSDQ